MKKKLKLSRETVRRLSSRHLTGVVGAMQDTPTHGCPPRTVTHCHSLCDSCEHTDCCLMNPSFKPC